MTDADRQEVERIVTRKALEVVLLVMLVMFGAMSLSYVLHTRINTLEAQVKELKAKL